MSNMKDFLSKTRFMTDWSGQEIIYGKGDNISIESLGNFFWEQGGKEYVNYHKGFYNEFEQIYNCALDDLENKSHWCVRDFLDALDCLGEEEIRKRIKGLRNNEI